METPTFKVFWYVKGQFYSVGPFDKQGALAHLDEIGGCDAAGYAVDLKPVLCCEIDGVVFKLSDDAVGY